MQNWNCYYHHIGKHDSFKTTTTSETSPYLKNKLHHNLYVLFDVNPPGDILKCSPVSSKNKCITVTITIIIIILKYNWGMLKSNHECYYP